MASREKKNVVIVIVWLPVALDLALHSNPHRRFDVLRMREEPVLLRVATRAESFMVTVRSKTRFLLPA
jgi:hypothetical protein